MAAHRPRESTFALVDIKTALAIITERVQPLGIVQIDATKAVRSVLAEDVVAAEPLPPFRASIMDGYAVVAEDGAGTLPVIRPVVAGDAPSALPKLSRGQIFRITTGAPVPEGADAVVKVEDTELATALPGGEEASVRIRVAVRPGENIRPKGSDISAGEVVLLAGTVLTPADVGVLAAVGAGQVPVYRRPRVAVLSTGTELIDITESEAAQHQIRDSNRPTLVALLLQHGFDVLDLGIVGDAADRVEAALSRGLTEADVLITTGGVSMGETDLVKPTLERLGCTIHFGRVQMKPGKPTTFATKGADRVVFALPGNPVSAIVTFYLFVLPALGRLANRPARALPGRIEVVLESPIKLDSRPEYQRARLTLVRGDTPGTFTVRASVTGGQASSRLTSMTDANGLLVLPAASDAVTRLEAGAVVEAIVIGSLV